MTLGVSDIILAELALVILALEFTSDNQQWSYQVNPSTLKVVIRSLPLTEL